MSGHLDRLIAFAGGEGTLSGLFTCDGEEAKTLLREITALSAVRATHRDLEQAAVILARALTSDRHEHCTLCGVSIPFDADRQVAFCQRCAPAAKAAFDKAKRPTTMFSGDADPSRPLTHDDVVPRTAI